MKNLPAEKRPKYGYQTPQKRRKRGRNQDATINADLNNYPWTSQEDSFLLSNLGKVSKKKMALELGRTFWAVRARIQRLKRERKMPEAEIKLKHVLAENKIGVREFAREIKMPVSTLSTFLSTGRLPKRWEGSKTEIKKKLFQMKGVSDKDLFESNGIGAAVAASKEMKRARPVAPANDWEGEMLNQDAMEWFGLDDDPFDKSAVRSESDLFYTGSAKKVKQAIETAIAKRQFIAVWGQVGCGKTMLWTSVHDRIRDRENVRVVKPLTIEKEKLTIHNLEEAFIIDLKAGRNDYTEPLRSSREARDRQVRELLELYDKEGVVVVLVIEEAHSIPMRTLKALKRLHEIQYGWSQPLSIVLLGQPELMDVKGDMRVREVSRRCRFIELASLRKPEFKSYLEFKFKRVKADANRIFSPDSWAAFQRKFAGPASALQVNNLAAFIMNRAEEVKQKKVDGAFIDAIQG